MDNTLPYGRPAATLTPGVLIIGIGVLHQLVGLVMGRAVLVDLVRAGVVGQVDHDPLRAAIVWFLFFGFLLIFTGVVLHRLEASGTRPTRSLALGFGALCLLGVLLMPASGFWLGFVPAVQLWRRAKP